MLASHLALVAGVLAASSLLVEATPVQKRCSATISSLNDVAAYVLLSLSRALPQGRSADLSNSDLDSAKKCTSSVHFPCPCLHSFRRLALICLTALAFRITIKSFVRLLRFKALYASEADERLASSFPDRPWRKDLRPDWPGVGHQGHPRRRRHLHRC